MKTEINTYYMDSYGKIPFAFPCLKAKESITTKMTHFLFPKNELTGRRTFKIIPNFFIYAQGRINYEFACPFYKITTDPELNKTVQSIFEKLVVQTQKAYPSTKNMSWRVRIKKDPSVNAFCLPGGKIIITTGIIETLKARVNKYISHEDLIASVLGHEMVHAIAEHGGIAMHLALLGAALRKAFVCLVLSLANPIPLLQLSLIEQYLKYLVRIEESINRCFPEKAAQWLCKRLEKRLEECLPIIILMNLSLYLFLYNMIYLLFDTYYSRSQELEADKYGLFLAKAAGYKPDAALRVQEMFMALKGEENKPKNWFKKVKGLIYAHPYSQVRFQECKKITSMLGKKEKID